jgi:hypothetical protein
MASLKKLAAVAHDIGHHAQSALSWVHPHLGEAAHAAGRRVVTVHLGALPPVVDVPEISDGLKLALPGLHAKFIEILARYGLNREVVASLTLEFEFPGDPFSSRVGVELLATNGRRFVAQLDLPGEIRVPTA